MTPSMALAGALALSILLLLLVSELRRRHARQMRSIARLATPDLPRNPEPGDLWTDPLTRRTHVYDPTKDRSRTRGGASR